MRETQALAGLNAFTISNNVSYAPQQVVAADRRIGGGHGITTRLNLIIGRSLYHAMSEEPTIATEQHNVALGYFSSGFPVEDQRVTRPDCREHAPPRDLQMKAAGRMQDLGCEFAFERVLLTDRRLRERHDALRGGLR